MTATLFTEVVTLKSRLVVGQDALNNDVYDWVRTESPAWVELGPGTEDDNARETTEATSTVYLPIDAVVEAVSEVEWGGHTWSVEGEPGVQPGGFVVAGYKKLGIKRVRG